MSVSPEPQPRLPPPRLLALDMGGLIVETLPAPGWAARFAARLLGRGRHCLPPGTDLPTVEQVATDLADGRARHDSWKDSTVGGAELSRGAPWYVGDTHRRDVVCGRRARAGTTILMRSRRTEPAPGGGPEPDHTVGDPAGPHALLCAALHAPTTSRGRGLHTTR
ncbi:hypothetical protein ABZ553_05580 [Streptomyces sparsogenes]|uniref:hypothetical protein n=1 Tax=Streptomyces sparsogenes TaxID=67365 RepID=UPI0033F89B95